GAGDPSGNVDGTCPLSPPGRTCCTRRWGHEAVPPGYDVYMLSRTSMYFFSTALRLTLRLGVRSPDSTDKSVERIWNFLMVSHRSSRALSWSTSPWMSSWTASDRVNSSYDRPPIPLRVAQSRMASGSSVMRAVQ